MGIEPLVKHCALDGVNRCHLVALIHIVFTHRAKADASVGIEQGDVVKGVEHIVPFAVYIKGVGIGLNAVNALLGIPDRKADSPRACADIKESRAFFVAALGARDYQRAVVISRVGVLPVAA